MSNSKSGNLRLKLTSTMHYNHEALELVLIIRPMGLLNVDFLNCKMKQCYWLRFLWFIIQGLKFSQTSTFYKMLVKNNIKEHFQKNLIKLPKKFTSRFWYFGLFLNISDKPGFSLKNQPVLFIPLPFP